MKKILLFLLIFLTSCTNKENLINQNQETKTSTWEIISWPIQELEEAKTYNYFTKNTKFTYCDWVSNYENKQDFYETEDVKLLFEKLNTIREYCKTSDWNKYIFWAYNDFLFPDIKIFTYDKSLDKIWITDENIYFRSYIEKWWDISPRNYWDISLEKYLENYIQSKNKLAWFWVKNWNIIPFSTYWVSITWHQESAPWVFSNIGQFFSQKTRNYCQSGLTPEWKLSVCFVDIFYDYNFVENRISQSRICSYYIDDNWEIKTLEKCLDFDYKKAWYKLYSKSKWLDFYQNEDATVSILELNLDSSNISFAWLNTKFVKWENWWDNEVELEYEAENSVFNRFNKYYAKEFRDKIDFDSRKYFVNAFVNGQFFTHLKPDEKTGLSFPIKSHGKIITSYMDNEIPKRTFVIDKYENAKIFEWYDKKYLENPDYKELIVAFSPEVNARKNEEIWRTYIWLKDSKTIVFFIAKNKNQKQMNEIIKNYWIKEENIIMMDGWPSSQFAYFNNKWPGSEFEQYYWQWTVPHYFVIYND